MSQVLRYRHSTLLESRLNEVCNSAGIGLKKNIGKGKEFGEELSSKREWKKFWGR